MWVVLFVDYLLVAFRAKRGGGVWWSNKRCRLFAENVTDYFIVTWCLESLVARIFTFLRELYDSSLQTLELGLGAIGGEFQCLEWWKDILHSCDDLRPTFGLTAVAFELLREFKTQLEEAVDSLLRLLEIGLCFSRFGFAGGVRGTRNSLKFLENRTLSQGLCLLNKILEIPRKMRKSHINDRG